MKAISWIGIFLSCLMLTACTAVTKTTKIDANAEPVRDVAIVILMGNLSTVPQASPSEKISYEQQFKVALQERLPSIFRKNGVPVKSMLVDATLAGNKMPLAPILESTDASHVLVLKVKAYNYSKQVATGAKVGGGYVDFDASLWDVRKKSVVWKATPWLVLVESQPLLRSQHMAGQILNGMNADGLITLKQEYAVDLSGERISDYYIGTSDR